MELATRKGRRPTLEGSAPAASGARKWLDHEPTTAAADAAARVKAAEQHAHDLIFGDDLFPGDSRGRVRRRWMLGADVLGIFASAIVAQLFHTGAWVTDESGSTGLLIIAFAVIWVGAYGLLGYYHLPERRLDYSLGDDFVPVLLVTTLAAWGGLVTAALTASGAILLEPWVLLWASTIVLVHCVRTVVRKVSVARAWYRQQVLVVGTSSDLRRIRRRLERHPEFGLQVSAAAYLDPPGGEAGRPENGISSIHLPIQSLFAAERGRVSEIVDFAREQGVNRVLIATPPRGLDEREALTRAVSRAGFAVDIASTEVGGVSQRASLHHVEGLPFVTVPAIERSRAVVGAKRWFDLGFSITALTVLSPLLLVIAIAIKIDTRGPILFRQPRPGRRRREFEMLKFRTMIAGADSMKAEIAEDNFHVATDGGQMFKVKGDPRITRVGGWLRRFSLDELPQLINVVRGDMSIVGPRPILPAEGLLVSEDYEDRFALRPGLTGPWQVHGRSNIGFDDMVRLDDNYAHNWSLTGDISLILRTVGAVTAGRGAY